MAAANLWMLGMAAAALGGCVAAGPHRDSTCPAAGGSLADLTNAEYAFSHAAATSVRGAFLAVLADESIVLQPDPRPGRALYEGSPENADRLVWYPVIADLASSADLGFTTGPWTYTIAANGKELHGSYVTVWKRMANCQWRVVFDGGVSHPAPELANAELHPSPQAAPKPPAQHLPLATALTETARSFHEAAQRRGLGASLPDFTAAEFRAYANLQMPFDGAAAAAAYFAAYPAAGTWIEMHRAFSADEGFAYAYGELSDVDANAARTAAYLEVWRYDAVARRWRIRLLLLSAYPHPMPKS